MADEKPKFPQTETWSQWSYEDVLAALTDERVEIRNLSWTSSPMVRQKPDKDNKPVSGTTEDAGQSQQKKLEDVQWFMFDPDAVDKTITGAPPHDLGYWAYKTQYFGVNIDWNAIIAFEKAVNDTNLFMLDLVRLRRGALDGASLSELMVKADQLGSFLSRYAGMFRKRADDLKGSDSALKGKASAVIQERLDYYADMLELWRDQVNNNHGKSIASAATDAYGALGQTAYQLYQAWEAALHMSLGITNPKAGLGGIRGSVIGWMDSIKQTMFGAGLLYGLPGYKLDQKFNYAMAQGATFDGALEYVKAYISDSLGQFVIGTHRGLCDPATWRYMNWYISNVHLKSFDVLDACARTMLPRLRDSYVVLARSLTELTDPDPFTPHAGAPGAGGPNDFPNWNMNFPPIDFNFPNDFPNFNNIPNYNNFPNFDNFPNYNDFPNYNNFPNYNDSPYGPGNFNIPGYDPNSSPYGGPNLNIPDKLFDPLKDMFNPLNSLFNPLGGMFNPLNGMFPHDMFGANSPGVHQLGPGLGPAVGQPRLGPLGELLGTDGKPKLGKHGELLDENNLPLLGPHGELLGPDGKPLRGPHGELLGLDGKPLPHLGQGVTASAGAGGPGPGGPRLPELPGSSSNPWQGSLSGSPPPRSGTSSVLDPSGLGGLGGLGGLPYLPGMGGMGGGMGGGDKNERERQTWLSEDEKVWGTDVAADMAVIGRPDDDEDEIDAEEPALPLGPVRARRPAPAREQLPDAPGQSEGEEGQTMSRRP
jgi:hypothetical protein